MKRTVTVGRIGFNVFYSSLDWNGTLVLNRPLTPQPFAAGASAALSGVRSRSAAFGGRTHAGTGRYGRYSLRRV